ncbi:MAG: hypothetical protein H3C47_08070 [Candidatus Cloacimonetes bacterium]|nr:hypothetical protein [Candidatus Cloacimonadota bacterium]
MLIHLGEDYFADSSKVILILNRESVDTNVSVIPRNCKSIVILDDTIHYSPIDSRSLRKRDNVLDFGGYK